MSRSRPSRSATACSCRACRARSTISIAPDDPRAGRAYNVYYVGVNIGGFLAPLICGTLGELYGWHYGFGAAGIGMFAGLLIYVAGRRYLPAEHRAARARRRRARAQATQRTASGCCCLGSGSRRRCSAAPTSRSATRCRSGPTPASIAPWAGFGDPDDLVPVAQSAAGDR